MWEDIGLRTEPHWTREPSLEDIECVCRRQLCIPAPRPCTATFYKDSIFTKLYLIACDDQSFLLRVMLPVSPHDKTRGEVATLRWVREHTNIPVPKVIAFDDSRDNSIGFEWILMEFLPGVPAYRRWRTMPWEQKLKLTKRVAEFQVQLFRNGASGPSFKKIGTLVPENGPGSAESPTRVAPGKLISHDYFIYDRLEYCVPRGPFSSSHAWLSSLLHLILLEQKDILETSEDEDKREGAEKILAAAERLLSFLPRVFPEDQEDEVATALWHDDLRLQNILIDDHGEITAIIEWDSTSAMPICFSTKMPEFFDRESPREEEPDRNTYSDETPSEAAEARERQNTSDSDELDNEGKNSLYWIHLMDYETTQLRKVYEARLKELWPDWPLEESRVKLDFCEAVLQCSCSISVKPVNRWLDSLERGHVISWEEACSLQWEYQTQRNPETGAHELWRRYQGYETHAFAFWRTLQH